jgi:hypothetical protein
MWALRFLNGPQAGLTHPLKQGKTRIGRAPSCDLQINISGVSKEHLEIQVAGHRVSVTDLKSSNGSFVNGVRIQTAILRNGDKLGLDQVLFDLVQMTQHLPAQVGNSHLPAMTHPSQMTSQPAQIFHHSVAQASGGDLPAAPASSAAPMSMPVDWKEKADHYLHEVIMPGLYRLVEVFQFRSVILGFAAVFVFLVTLLSVFPMNQITSDSIRVESRRRALTVARALANSNEKAIRTGEMSGYSADLVLRDEGISHVYILGKDGSIIAPPEMAGMQAKDLAGFVGSVKTQTREFSAEVGGGQIAASCPILVFDPELQQNVAKAHAVVVYDTESMKFDDGRALSLFIQMLTMAMMLGAVLFFLMYKVIEYPFRRLNQEIDSAMREGRDHAQIDIKLPLLQQTLVSLNSLLTRSLNQNGGGMAQGSSTRDSEWINMLQLFGYPAMLLTKDMTVLSINAPFESLTGTQTHLLQGQSLNFLPDQALQKNISELVMAAQNNTLSLHQDRLDISGHLFTLQCQAVTIAGEACYYLISISPAEQAEGGAA